MPTFVKVMATTLLSGRVGMPSIQGLDRRWIRGRRGLLICSWRLGYASSSVGYLRGFHTPYAYDYGDNITYQDGNVMYGDQVSCTEAQYAEQASQIADTGRQAKPAADEKWEAARGLRHGERRRQPRTTSSSWR